MADMRPVRVAPNLAIGAFAVVRHALVGALSPLGAGAAGLRRWRGACIHVAHLRARVGRGAILKGFGANKKPREVRGW